MTTITLPEPIAAYFAADSATAKRSSTASRRRPSSETKATPTPAARPSRHGRTPRSTDTVHREPLAAEEDGHVARPGCRNFPGSPVDLRYVFRLERGKIASLEIGHELRSPTRPRRALVTGGTNGIGAAVVNTL